MYKPLYLPDTVISTPFEYGSALLKVPTAAYTFVATRMGTGDWSYLQISYANKTEIIKVIGRILPDTLVVTRKVDGTDEAYFPAGSILRYVPTVAAAIDAYTPLPFVAIPAGAIQIDNGVVKYPNINLAMSLGLQPVGSGAHVAIEREEAAYGCCPDNNTPHPMDAIDGAPPYYPIPDLVVGGYWWDPDYYLLQGMEDNNRVFKSIPEVEYPAAYDVSGEFRHLASTVQERTKPTDNQLRYFEIGIEQVSNTIYGDNPEYVRHAADAFGLGDWNSNDTTLIGIAKQALLFRSSAPTGFEWRLYVNGYNSGDIGLVVPNGSLLGVLFHTGTGKVWMKLNGTWLVTDPTDSAGLFGQTFANGDYGPLTYHNNYDDATTYGRSRLRLYASELVGLPPGAVPWSDTPP